jgi:hypothetical protein
MTHTHTYTTKEYNTGKTITFDNGQYPETINQKATTTYTVKVYNGRPYVTETVKTTNGVTLSSVNYPAFKH